MKLKTIAIALLFMFITAGGAWAQTLYTPDQATITWDAVTSLTDGTPIAPDDTVLYEVFLSTDGLTGEKVDTTNLLQFTLTFTAEGVFYVGVMARRIPAGVGLVNCNDQTCPPSTITWSNSTDTNAVPEPFGFINYLAPKGVTGLRKPQ